MAAGNCSAWIFARACPFSSFAVWLSWQFNSEATNTFHLSKEDGLPFLWTNLTLELAASHTERTDMYAKVVSRILFFKRRQNKVEPRSMCSLLLWLDQPCYLAHGCPHYFCSVASPETHLAFIPSDIWIDLQFFNTKAIIKKRKRLPYSFGGGKYPM